MASGLRNLMGRWRANPLTGTAVALLAIAVVFAAWAGVGWVSAAQAGPPPLAAIRDQALQSGEQAVQNFNTLDYRTVASGLALWEQSSTGALRAEIASGKSQFEAQVRQARTISTAKILDAALTSLNAKAGTATIIAAVQLTVTPVHGSPAVKQSRLTGTLLKTAAGWKLSALSQVAVGAATGSGH